MGIKLRSICDKNYKVYLIAIFLILPILCSCGFKLRAVANFVFSNLYITGQIHFGLKEELEQEINANASMNFATDAQNADVILEILQHHRYQEVISLNQQGQVRELRLIETIEFVVRNKENTELIAPSRLTETRDIIRSEAAVLAKQIEEGQLYQNMEQNLARQITERLSSIKNLKQF